MFRAPRCQEPDIQYEYYYSTVASEIPWLADSVDSLILDLGSLDAAWAGLRIVLILQIVALCSRSGQAEQSRSLYNKVEETILRWLEQHSSVLVKSMLEYLQRLMQNAHENASLELGQRYESTRHNQYVLDSQNSAL